MSKVKGEGCVFKERDKKITVVEDRQVRIKRRLLLREEDSLIKLENRMTTKETGRYNPFSIGRSIVANVNRPYLPPVGLFPIRSSSTTSSSSYNYFSHHLGAGDVLILALYQFFPLREEKSHCQGK